MKVVELIKFFPEMIRCSIIVVWGLAAFSLLASSPALAKEHGSHEQSTLLMMKPADLPGSARIAGDDMYLYEGNAKTYLYIEQDGGKHLLVLDVTKPEKVSVAAETQLAVDVPYDFVCPLGGDSVLIHFRTGNGQASEWGRLETQQASFACTRNLDAEFRRHHRSVRRSCHCRDRPSDLVKKRQSSTHIRSWMQNETRHSRSPKSPV